MAKDKNISITAERIRTLRVQQGLSLEEMGKIIGASKSSMSEYENGDTKLSTDKLQRYADYFHVSMNYLTGKDASDPQAAVPLFTSSETEMVLGYRHKSKREQRIMRLQAMSDEDYDRMYSTHHTETEQNAYLSDNESKEYGEGKKGRGRKK